MKNFILSIENDTEYEFSDGLKTSVERLCLKAIELENVFDDIKLDISVSLTFAKPDDIKALNAEYRGKDAVTDVLSFPMYERDELSARASQMKLIGELMLGDIVICPSKAETQAEEYGNSLEREICFLAVHSILHLLGYDHENANDERAMIDRQKAVMQYYK